MMSVQSGSSEKLTEDAVEDMLDKVVKLLAYISDKDLFAEFYRKRLSRRLLQDKSASDDHERAVLTRLKQQCGAQFTSKVRPASAPMLRRDQTSAMLAGSTGRRCCDAEQWKRSMCRHSHEAHVREVARLTPGLCWALSTHAAALC